MQLIVQVIYETSNMCTSHSPKKPVLKSPFLLLFFMTLLPTSTRATFNLYLSHEEVSRILGLQAELFYVREGVVNDYAMQWTIPIAPEVHSIYFKWQALAKRPVLYSLALTYNTSDPLTTQALYPPSVNISSRGALPLEPSTFRFDLPCTGAVNAEVVVVLHLNVTASKTGRAPTLLKFRRKKICLKGVSAEDFAPHQAAPRDAAAGVGVVVLSTASALVLVLGILLAVALLRRRAKRRATLTASSAPSHGENHSVITNSDICTTKGTGVSVRSTLLPPNPSLIPPSSATYTLPSSFTANSYASLYKMPVYSCTYSDGIPPCSANQGGSTAPCLPCPPAPCSAPSCCPSSPSCASSSATGDEGSASSDDPLVGGAFPPLADHVTRQFKAIQVERRRVRVTSVLQEGQEGLLYQGWLQREHPQLDQQVLIKTLKEDAPSCATWGLLREASILLQVQHKHLLSPVGMSHATSAKPFLIYPDAHAHNLKLFLLSVCRGGLQLGQVVQVLQQAASAVNYMHANNVVHGDIACRNCFISDSLHLRLCDAAIARDLFPHDYESPLGGSSPSRPFRWDPPELMGETGTTVVSTASDVWSLGVLMWECATGGQTPYSEVPSSHLHSLLQEGIRLGQPPSVPDDLYHLFTACWVLLPSDRPQVATVVQFLNGFRDTINQFI